MASSPHPKESVEGLTDVQQIAATSTPERIAHAPAAVERRTTERPWSGTPSAHPKTTSSPAKMPAQRVAGAGGDEKEWEEF